MNTKPHLSNNGGIRGHSAGEFFPFMVVGIGTENEWVVMNPNGKMSGRGTIGEAFALARVRKKAFDAGNYNYN